MEILNISFRIRYKLFGIPVTWIWGKERVVYDGKKIFFDTGNTQGTVLGITKDRGISVNGYLSSIEVRGDYCNYLAKGRIISLDIKIENCKEIQNINRKILSKYPNKKLMPNKRLTGTAVIS